MRQFFILSLFLAVVVGGIGCTYRMGDFTALSSKNVPLKHDVPSPATGEACKITSFLGAQLGPPSLEDAVDQAVAARGNALINQVTYVSRYNFVFGRYLCFKVKGDVVTLE